MQAYSYDNNGFFVGPCNCQKDPVRSAREGREVYCLPKNATTVAPPDIKDGERAVWDGAAWRVELIPVPEPVIPTPSEQRKTAYETEPLVEVHGDLITVDEAERRFYNYFAEGRGDVYVPLQAKIAEAKEMIREKYPDDAERP